jgi:anti-sigma B factor antagonist
MEIVTAKQNDISIFKLQGRLDSNTAPEFEETIFNDIKAGTLKMVVDFGNLDYISSAGLRVILKATKELKRSEGSFVLCDMKDYVKEVFEISGFDSFLPIVSDMDAALLKVA